MLSAPAARRALLAPALLLASAPAALAGVIVVDAAGGGDHTSIAAAVAAASSGDTLLVKPGLYGGFLIQGKSLVVVADGGTAYVEGTPAVRDLPAGGTVVLSGLESYGELVSGPGLSLLLNQGSVRVQDCTLRGAHNTECQDSPEPGNGRPGAFVFGCADVAFTNCDLTGGDGAGGVYGDPCYIGGTGGHGLKAHDSTIALYDCVLQAGKGGGHDGESVGGDGGDGASAQGGRLFASGCELIGGPGGQGFDFIPITGYGNGGDGLHVQADAEASLLANDYQGGAAGLSSFGNPGQPGLGLGGEGEASLFTGSAHAFDASPAAVREGHALTLSFTGAPTDVAFLMVGLGPDELLLPNAGGVVLLDLPLLLGPLPLAAVPGSGTLSLALTVPSLGPSLEALPIHMQGVVLEAAGYRLASAASVVLLDASL